MTKALIPVLAVVAAGTATLAFVQMNRVGGLQDQVATLSAQVAQRDKSLADALKGLNDATAKLAEDRDNIARLTKERDEARARTKELAEAAQAGAGIASAPSGQTPDAKAGEEIRNIFQGFARRMDDPEVRKAMKSQQERLVGSAYDAVLKKLNLSEDDSKLVTELISDRNMAALDQGRKLLRGASDEANLQAVRKEIEGTKLEYDAKLKGMLGEDKFKELATFEQTVGDQRTLDGFARSFERKNIPMQPEQRDALTNIMREERLKLGPSSEIPDLGGGPGMSMLMTETELKEHQQQEQTYQANVLNRASQAGLSPDQVNALRDSFNQRNEQRTMSRAFGRAFLGGGRP
jgi:hypothetical protein